MMRPGFLGWWRRWALPALLSVGLMATGLIWTGAHLWPGRGDATSGDRLKPEAPVIGVALNGQSRAYPLLALFGSEVVNDELGGQPIVVTF